MVKGCVCPLLGFVVVLLADCAASNDTEEEKGDESNSGNNTDVQVVAAKSFGTIQ